MAQQTFSGVPGAFSAGEVLSSADQNLLRDYLVAQIKEGMTGDTGEILPMIMDLTNNRIVLDAGGLEFSNGSTQTIAGMTAAGGTFTGAITGTDATFTGTTTTYLDINAQTGTTYTFVIADAGKLVTSSNGSAQTITVPPNSSVAFPVGTQIIVQAIGSGTATLAQGTGVTINSVDSNKDISAQWASVALIKTATNVWSLIGALA
jgi:hypothetical protein